MLQTLPCAGKGNNDYLVMVRLCYRRMFVCIGTIFLRILRKHESNIIQMGEHHSGCYQVKIDNMRVCLRNLSSEGRFFKGFGHHVC